MKPTELDELQHMLYRLDHLIKPDPKIRQQLLQEIQRCKNHSNADPSTRTKPRANSTATPSSPKQLTLA